MTANSPGPDREQDDRPSDSGAPDQATAGTFTSTAPAGVPQQYTFVVREDQAPPVDVGGADMTVAEATRVARHMSVMFELDAHGYARRQGWSVWSVFTVKGVWAGDPSVPAETVTIPDVPPGTGAISVLGVAEGQDPPEGWTRLDVDASPGPGDNPLVARFAHQMAVDGLVTYSRPGDLAAKECDALIADGYQPNAYFMTDTAPPAVRTVNVDHAIIDAGGDPDEENALRVLVPDEDDGDWARLHAALRSIHGRRDGDARLRIAAPKDSWVAKGDRHHLAAFSWLSFARGARHQAWAVTGDLLVKVDADLNTRIRVEEPELVVVGTTGATQFVGFALADSLGRALRPALAHAHARALVGEPQRIGTDPVQLSDEWSAERFAALALQNPLDRPEDNWFYGQRAMQTLVR